MPDARGSARARTSGPRPPRVLLVDPYLAREDPMERKFVELYPSLGLLTLASYLREAGVAVRLVDLTFERSLRPFDRALDEFGPDLVGVHTKTLTFARSASVARRAAARGVFVVAGGPDAATRPETYLRSGFDAVATGEGEATLVDLAGAVPHGDGPGAIGGLARLESGRIVRGPPRPFLRDLDALPLPAWDLLDMEGYLGRWQRRTGERRAAVLTSRGCPFDCSWCSKPTFGRTFRQQSPERVLRELTALHDRYAVDYVRFCDDVFGVQRSWLDALLRGLVDSGLGLKFECLARVDLLKPDLLARMREAGLQRVYVGVESGSQKMLDLMNRGTKLHQVERVAAGLREEGIRQFWFLMLGYPGETVEDIEATLRLFRRFSPEEYSVSIAVPVPGTRFYESVKERLRLGARPGRSSGGKRLLFEGAYPESLYRWTQARFEFEWALARARGKVSDPLLEGLGHAADSLNDKLVRPLLLGERRPRRRRAGGQAFEFLTGLAGRRGPPRPGA